MLVLTRNVGEEIIIDLPSGDSIAICLAEIRGDKARIGITAPRALPVHRKEVHQRISEALAFKN